MKILRFNENSIELDTYYKIMRTDRNGDAEEFSDFYFDYDNYNPFDLKEMVNMLIIVEKEYKGLFIKKVSEKIVDNETINKIRLEIEAKKYNL